MSAAQRQGAIDSGSSSHGWRLAMLWLLACLAPLGAQTNDPAADLRLEVEPLEARVGDRIRATLTVDLPAGIRLEPARLGPQLGPFEVEGGSWNGPLQLEERTRWIWSGRLVAFRTGSHELPPIELQLRDGEDRLFSVASDPVQLEVLSVLNDEELAQGEPELADLKRPESLPANLRPLWIALIVVAALLLGAAVLWWLHRRYGPRLAAVAAPDDPFHRTPPHVWVYAELQKLLDRRLPEQNRIEQFYSELSWILKRYLTGRYRVELMESTTAEVPAALRRGGASEAAIEDVRQLLDDCDGVKFARQTPASNAWREAVERVYHIVDTTKPAEIAKGAA